MNLALVRTSTCAALLAMACCAMTAAPAAEPSKDGIYFPTATTHTETDEYTRYELLDARQRHLQDRVRRHGDDPGAKYYYNPIRKGASPATRR